MKTPGVSHLAQNGAFLGFASENQGVFLRGQRLSQNDVLEALISADFFVGQLQSTPREGTETEVNHERTR